MTKRRLGLKDFASLDNMLVSDDSDDDSDDDFMLGLGLSGLSGLSGGGRRHWSIENEKSNIEKEQEEA